jgi:hypothetical protein
MSDNPNTRTTQCCGTCDHYHPADDGAGDCEAFSLPVPQSAGMDCDAYERRLMVCEACGGDGGFEENCRSVGGYDSVRWVRCAACRSKGEVVVRPPGEFYVVVNRDAFESMRRVLTGEAP